MLNQVAIIVNKYAGVISQVISNPCARVEGSFDKDAFELKCAPVLKFQYLDAVVIDASAVTYNLAEAVRWLKVSLNKNVRIIVFAPNMNNKAVKTQLYVYGVYDVVIPSYSEETMDDVNIVSTLINELKWALQNPVGFAKVADELAVSINTTVVQGQPSFSPARDGKRKESPLKAKPRIIGFYGSSDENLKLTALSSKYTLAGLYEADESKLENIDLVSCELIVCDNASVEFVAYVKSLVDVNKARANVIAGFTDPETAEQCRGLKGINVFVYKKDGDFVRQVSINSQRKAIESVDRDCQIISVYGVKGGCGSTTVTAALAKEYKKTHPGRKVLALDFTTNAGDLGSKFGIDTPENNIFGCAASFLKARAEHMDIEILKNKILNYCNYDERSKVYVIPTGFTDIYSFTNYVYSATDISYIYTFILKKLANYFDAIFVDTGKYSGITAEIALEYATKLILVSDCTLASVSQLQIKMDDLKNRKYQKPLIVSFNKANTKKDTKQYDNKWSFLRSYGNINNYELPFEKTLFRESDEMGTKYSIKYAKVLRAMCSLR